MKVVQKVLLIISFFGGGGGFCRKCGNSNKYINFISETHGLLDLLNTQPSYSEGINQWNYLSKV